MVSASNKVVWITGASSGIGRALALEYAKQGACLILSARREQVLLQVMQACKAVGLSDDDVLILPLDVTDQAQLKDKVSQALVFKGYVDLLINNAGISQRSTCLTTELETYRTLFEVDVFGQIALTKELLPSMVERGQGHIAVTASVAGKMGVPFRTGYCAAKHAVMGFFDALRAEVAHQNIDVSTIVPGYIRTNISKNALSGDGAKFDKLDDNIAGGMNVEECATTIVKGLNKGKKEIAVGKGVEMHALWIKRFFPNLLTKIMEKQYQKRVEQMLDK